jgi:hypothetical protein
MSLIVPAGPAGFVRKQSIASLFGHRYPILQSGIALVVRKSFVGRAARNVTDAAIKERVDYCIALAAELHCQKQWMIERILDEMPDALKSHLDGTKWEPSNRFCWFGANA